MRNTLYMAFKMISPLKRQNLSPKAAADKKARDLAFAKTTSRRNKKAENQRKRREAEKNGVDITDKDYDHTTNSFVSVKDNRGEFGKGTRT